MLRCKAQCIALQPPKLPSMAETRYEERCSGAVHDRSDAAILAAAFAELESLDPEPLRRRWRALVGGALPLDLGRPLTLRVLFYKLQAQRLGDLDKASLRELASFTPVRAGTVVDPPSTGISVCRKQPRPSKAVQPAIRALRIARPGTLLTREYGGVLHQVLVLDAGASWNGKTYDSLSRVALAITGTKWNGPRFFGLRDPAKGQDADHRIRSGANAKLAVVGKGRAGYAVSSRPPQAPS